MHLINKGLYGDYTNGVAIGLDEVIKVVLENSNVVDVLFYDTTKDTNDDWRKDRSTSWYNEALNTATRGSKKEFPQKVFIVAEDDKVTIYDATDPLVPMWMVFNGASGSNTAFLRAGISSVVFLNGVMATGHNVPSIDNMLLRVDFLSEMARRDYSTVAAETTGIVNRNSCIFGSSTGPYVVNRYVNDVAMIMLPDRTTPTIAVATGGGVSVIDGPAGVGTVVDSSNTNAFGSVWFEGTDIFVGTTDLTDDVVRVYDDYSADGFSQRAGYSQNSIPAISQDNSVDPIGTVGAIACVGQGLTLLKENPLEPTKGMVNYITSDYQSGWQVGDSLMATLAETEEGTIGTDVTTELVQNGDFDDTVGWTLGTGWSIGSGVATKTAGSDSYMYQVANLITSRKYKITYTVSNYGGGAVRPFIGASGAGVGTYVTANGVYSEVLVCTGGLLVQFNANASFVGSIDNVIVTELDVPDRSPKNNQLQVVGQLTREPVATGSELVAYSGFSENNYIEQPYNSDLDFGTGDFCIMGWLKSSGSDGTQLLVARQTAAGASSFYINHLYDETIRIVAGTGVVVSSSTISHTGYDFIVAKRVDGVLSLSINNKEEGSVIDSSDVTLIGARLRLGASAYDGSNPAVNAKLALWRISGTAPSADQIKEIYDTEKRLFKDGAKCTLTGNSNNVLSLNSDSGTLLVGTEDGLSDFVGVVNMEEPPIETEGEVGNISSSAGYSIVESEGIVTIKLPKINPREI